MARPLPFLAGAVLFLGPFVSACGHHSRDGRDDVASGTGTRASATDVALDEPFSASSLNLEIRSGEITIRGGQNARIVLHCEGRNAQRCGEVRATLRGSNLEVAGGPRHISMRLDVPSQLGLRVRMPAGELNIEGVRGDKDIRLNAGELDIEVSDPSEYGPVKASVLAGEISARPFDGSAEGVFRSFEHHGEGRYRLAARLLAGEIMLR